MIKIATVHSDFKQKFGIPRQSGVVSTISKIVFEKEFSIKDSVRGLEGYSHIWVIWGFSQNHPREWTPTVRPPRLGGNKKMGVFATRSPYRPNPIGLSSVKLVSIDYGENIVLTVEGGDMLDGTPVYDIKPYLKYTDSHPDAQSGFAGKFVGYSLEVEFACPTEGVAEEDKRSICGLLSQDPRPAYQEEGREYGMSYKDYQIRFCIEGGKVKVLSIVK